MPPGLLVAKTALSAGRQVDIFLAGDAVGLLRPATLDAGAGIGTGSMREHVDALVAGGATFYASGQSSKARGLAPTRSATWVSSSLRPMFSSAWLSRPTGS